FKNDRLKDKMKQAFVEKAVAINDISDRHISLEEMEKAFEIGFKKGLNIDFKPLELNEKQQNEINELIDKYKSDEWNYRK
ncbi:octanoyltransferase, partial [Staphylococcus xylosus]|nr:octanoyltransferase [Staphylococcus xylosus]